MEPDGERSYDAWVADITVSGEDVVAVTPGEHVVLDNGVVLATTATYGAGECGGSLGFLGGVLVSWPLE